MRATFSPFIAKTCRLCSFVTVSSRSVKRGGTLRHPELNPTEKIIDRNIFLIVGAFTSTPIWEQFEAMCLKNVDRGCDIPHFCYACGRFEEYKKANPKSGTFKLQGVYDDIANDYFKENPYVDILHKDGSKEPTNGKLHASDNRNARRHCNSCL